MAPIVVRNARYKGTLKQVNVSTKKPGSLSARIILSVAAKGKGNLHAVFRELQVKSDWLE